MSAERFEAFLARLYSDAAARARFKANPFAEGRRSGLKEDECRALETMDWTALELTAGSFARKRELKRRFLGRKAWRWLAAAWQSCRTRF